MVPSNKTILLVEDDRDDALFMKMALDAAGVQNPVIHVENGKDAIVAFQGRSGQAGNIKPLRPYLVLLDLKLPYIMGLEVLKWIREQPALRSTIVVVLTASASPRDIDEAYALGANAYLVKPASFEKLQGLARSLREFWLVHNQASPQFATG